MRVFRSPQKSSSHNWRRVSARPGTVSLVLHVASSVSLHSSKPGFSCSDSPAPALLSSVLFSPSPRGRWNIRKRGDMDRVCSRVDPSRLGMVEVSGFEKSLSHANIHQLIAAEKKRSFRLPNDSYDNYWTGILLRIASLTAL